MKKVASFQMVYEGTHNYLYSQEYGYILTETSGEFDVFGTDEKAVADAEAEHTGSCGIHTGVADN